MTSAGHSSTYNGGINPTVTPSNKQSKAAYMTDNNGSSSSNNNSSSRRSSFGREVFDMPQSAIGSKACSVDAPVRLNAGVNQMRNSFGGANQRASSYLNRR